MTELFRINEKNVKTEKIELILKPNLCQYCINESERETLPVLAFKADTKSPLTGMGNKVVLYVHKTLIIYSTKGPTA